MQLTESMLVRILPRSRYVAPAFVPALNRAMTRYGINSSVRVAAFLAQVGHESAQLTALVENLNYSAVGLANTWPSRFAADRSRKPYPPNLIAMSLARKPELIANHVYANRNGNGSEASGDGWRFRGRGLIQITGRANYNDVARALRLDLLAHPELLEQPELAALSAAWWWSARGLNELADAGKFEQITRVINGGTNGLVDRVVLWHGARLVLV